MVGGLFIIQRYQFQNYIYRQVAKVVIMKIKQHNLSTSVQPTQHPNTKPSKIITRQATQKLKPSLKQNLPPNPPTTSTSTISSTTTIPSISTTPQKPPPPDSSLKPLKQIKCTEFNPVLEYEKQILKYLKNQENQGRIGGNFLRNHLNIGQHHRGTFVKHFFKVGKKFKLRRTTLYLAVYYMDRYLEKNQQIEKREAMIAALACLFIAMKYEQIYPPQLSQWTQPISQILLAESQILKSLNFTLSHTSTQHYLQLYFSKLQISQRDKDMIRLLADVSLFDQNLYKYSASQLSAAILYSIVNRGKLEEKMEMSLKWMMERNQKYVDWLQSLRIGKSYG